MPKQTSSSEAEQFFYDHAGYSYDPAKETKDEGRRKGAILLASAERWACETGYHYAWEYDNDIDSSNWIDDNEDGGKNCNPRQTWLCLMYDERGKIAQSLGGIDFGRGGNPHTDPYRRVVESNLALDEWHMVVKS